MLRGVQDSRVPMAQQSKDWDNLIVYINNAIATGLLTPEETKQFKYGIVSAHASKNDTPNAIAALSSITKCAVTTPR